MARPGNLTWHAAALPSLSPARGFTLIELMVTLAILALLLMVAAPMATDWASGTRTHQGRATLVQAYSQAKALSLRNPCAIGSGGTVVTFKASVQDGRIALQSLLEGDSSCDFLEDFAQPDKTMPQQMLLPAGVSLQLGGQPVAMPPAQVTGTCGAARSVAVTVLVKTAPVMPLIDLPEI